MKIKRIYSRASMATALTALGFAATLMCVSFITTIHQRTRTYIQNDDRLENLDINQGASVFKGSGVRITNALDVLITNRSGISLTNSSDLPVTTTLDTPVIRETKERVFLASNPQNTAPRRPNVLFMMTDDMRAQLGCYQDDKSPLRNPRLLTPNLDRLASRSLLLKRAFVQFSLCGPSRTSILTSRRPDNTRIFDNRNYWREFGGNYTSLPQYFKQHGYHTVGIGKVFHRDVSSNDNDPGSWSVPYIMPKHKESVYLTEGEAGWRAVTRREQARVELMDTLAVESASEVLRELAPRARSGEQPFFLALGFKKPHSSYVCPKEFYDLYPLESEEQFLSDISWQTVAFKRSRKLKNVTITDDGQVQLPHETLRHLRRAYFACISYVDSLVGKILGTLDTLGLTDNTIVSFVSDHGYHFGENGLYGKQSLHDTGTHVPMMIRVPGRTDQGVVSKSLVEGLDLFPTLVDAAGIPPLPLCSEVEPVQVLACTQGRSFLSLVNYPEKTIKGAALSQIALTLRYMRYSIRTARFRYSEWAQVRRDTDPEGAYQVEVVDPEGYEAELYDHLYDRDESVNVSDDPRYSRIKKRLSQRMQDFVLGRTGEL